MGKIIGAALVGVIIGAAVGEAIKRQKPELPGQISAKIKKGLAGIRDAFKEGYAQAAAPAAEADAEPAPAV